MPEKSDSRVKRREPAVGAWTPFHHSIFLALWIANIVSNVGTWMQNTATAWLMTSLAPTSVMVALVQTATSLPIFLLALPAGALADVLDRRRLILFTQGWMLVAAALLGWLTLTGHTTPWILLVLTLLLGLGAAMNAPAWQAIIPELVTKPEIRAAVSLNSAGFNVARSIGPALGGLVVGAFGAGTAFLINAASFLAVMLVLFFWKRAPRESTLPTERMIGAMKTGVRYVRHDPALQAVLIRSTPFMVCASALVALLPLLARQELGLGSVGYGLLLGAFGAGAVAAAALLPSVLRRLSTDEVIVVSTLLFAATLVALAFIDIFPAVCAILFVGGTAWLALLSLFNSSAQTVVPAWVRGRALSVYMIFLFGGLAGGSILWGAAAAFIGIPDTLLTAAGSLVAGLLLTARYRMSEIEDLDLTPTMHWGAPSRVPSVESEDGPVLVTLEYHIDPAQWPEFGLVMRRMRKARLRQGAMRWALFVDASDPNRCIESFIVESWVEHLRQHERVTAADREIEKQARAFHGKKEPPKVTHFLAKSLPEPSRVKP